jgi:cell division protein ZapE
MNLMTQYDAAIATGEIQNDILQREIIIHMQELADALNQPKSSWFRWRNSNPVKGLYVYGPVGAGKTYLVDLFFQHLEEPKKARYHFHHFMQQIDAQLRKVQGQKDPLRLIAKHIAKTTRVLCFDEFLVHDVAYAMILTELLQALIAEQVVIVISSNTPPEDLYRNGVQRDRFLPAIALIKQYCDVLKLDEPKDYRLGRESLVDAYLYPLNAATQQKMVEQFDLLAEDTREIGVILVQNREIPFVKCAKKSIWFDFNVVCNLPRSQLDYLEIADRFDHVFVSNVPQLTESNTTQTIMLVHFIDVMYDRGIKVILSAAVPVEALYLKGEMASTFQRTLSRLIEMQSADYIKRHPRRIDKAIS